MAEPFFANQSNPVVVLSESAARKTADVVMQVLAERPASGAIPDSQSYPMQRDVRWLCKSVGEISAESTGDVEIYSGETEGSETATGKTLKAYNRSTADIPDDEWVYIEFLGGMANPTWSIYSTSATVALKEGLLDGDLAKATNTLTGPTTATMSVHEFNDDGDLVDSGDNITITNRDTSLELTAGDYVVASLFGSEYRPVYPSLNPQCPAQNEIQVLTIFGSPTGGTFDLDVTVDGTTETVVIDFDATAAEVETQLETHSEIASGDVDCSGGDFPDVAIQIEFEGDLAETGIPIMMPDHTLLTGGSGVAVFVSVDQHGRE